MTSDRNAFLAHELRVPRLSAAEARAIAAEHFGVQGEARELGSQQDQNFRIDAFVLKVSNPAFGIEELDLQNRAMEHVAARLPGVVPVARAGRDGTEIVRVAGHDIRLVTWLDGEPLDAFGHLAPVVLRAAGGLVAGVAAVLGGLEHAAPDGFERPASRALEHPAADRVLQWDVRRAGEVVEALAPCVGDPARRALLERTMARAARALGPLAPALRLQVVHGDPNAQNVLARRGDDGRPVPCGLLDFGDACRSWTAAECAVLALSAGARRPGRIVQDAAEIVRGFHAVLALGEEEVEALPALMAARAALCAASCEQQAGLDPDKPYAIEGAAEAWRDLDAVAAMPAMVARAAFRAACGLPPPALPRVHRGAPPAPGLDGARVLDLSTRTDALPPGAWRDPAALAALAAPVAIGRHGEGRIVHDRGATLDEPATVHLGLDLFLAQGTPVRAPLAGRVLARGPREVILDVGDGLRLRVAGVMPAADEGARGAGGDEPREAGRDEPREAGRDEPREAGRDEPREAGRDEPREAGRDEPRGTGSDEPRGAGGEEAGAVVAAGEALGVVAPAAPGDRLPPHVHVQLAAGTRDEVAGMPGLVPSSLADAWLAISPDPGPLLGLDTPTTDEDEPTAEVLARRRRAVASPQRLYFPDAPPQIERGWRQWLFDVRGRPYLDLVNNVAVLGHSHPAVEAAAARQLRRLNTNSRFLYDALGRFAERLAALAPDPLDVVFCVNSGSEAVDLALRLAREHTGRRDLVCLTGAYHGWTGATDETVKAPPWVHPIDPPHLDPDRSLAQLEHVLARHPPAALLCEAVLGNWGGVLLPGGWLAAAYERVRAAGGLCIADEVQVGYGRPGTHFWAFAREGVVPDLVTLAKPAGNGHPLGAVIAPRAIADAFDAREDLFSSPGGGPVSCEIGLAVLDALEREGLQANARRVGDHLTKRLTPFVERFDAVTALHGAGLYQGLELASRPTAFAVSERLLELGMLVQPTGPDMTVLKLKPPLCLAADDVDLLTDALTRTFENGW